MTKNQHIALWTCPRTRSTLLALSFSQLEECIVYDEPLYAHYLLKNNVNHPNRELVIAKRETDYQKVLQKMTGDLPEGKTFSFQKQMAKHVLLDYDNNWLKSMTNLFLIRNPKEIISSYIKACQILSGEEIGMKALYDFFKKVEHITRSTPLVVDSTDLIKNPEGYLRLICDKLGVAFSKKMMTWNAGLETNKDSISPFPWLWTGDLPPTAWYTTIASSTGFMPYEEREVDLSYELMQIFEQCIPFYDKLYKYRTVIDS